MIFKINGYIWRVKYVAKNSPCLVDRMGVLTVATTDPYDLTIYISSSIYGQFHDKVLVHELAHAVMLSYYLIDDIHSVVYPTYWMEAEERVCNFIADYGFELFHIFQQLRA